MTYATTFSGIGGWELGLNACGWELAWQCERDAWCRRLLKERFGVPICSDIRHLVEWLRWRHRNGFQDQVDLLVPDPKPKQQDLNFSALECSGMCGI